MFRDSVDGEVHFVELGHKAPSGSAENISEKYSARRDFAALGLGNPIDLASKATISSALRFYHRNAPYSGLYPICFP